ncbi:DNA-binding protein [Sphaerisporangium corydalis]|uniref:DNA-binding protein n=1 Tax=Sphaerisporangium corydalis TaxID=1441875 RepID=A0ABV9E7C6_9ACTN|nr:DNA-binding protein [Sphaerisporangium corydalis]
MVRLVAGELGAAEDLAAGFLGLVPSAEPAVVGLGMRQALGFPEWVLAHHPEDGHQALAVVPELERAAKQVKSKPKAALDAYLALARQLAAAVPHFLPTFYEQAGRTFLAMENATYAAQMFAKARKAEAEHGLTVDEDRLDAVFLEYALAGALPVKVLAAYAKDLSARVAPEEALRRFTSLCMRRTAGGLPPSAQMTTELLRLAKAAGEDPAAVERAYLAEVVALPSALRAAVGWWKAHRAALVALARQDVTFRGTLLNLMPQSGGHEIAALWLSILEDSGATEGLCHTDGSARGGPGGVTGEAPRPADGMDGVVQPSGTGAGAGELVARPVDGVVGWVRRFGRLRGYGWRQQRMPELYSLVERVAGRLRDELAESGEALTAPIDVDLLDLLLSLDVPVSVPEDGYRFALENWARGEGQRDLLALATDERFRRAFHEAADRFGNDRDGLQAIALLSESPGGRPMLTEWVREVAGRSIAAGLPGLPDSLQRLMWLPSEALVLAKDEVAAAAGADLAEILARTLRAGLFDELGWPAWEEACALVPPKKIAGLVVSDAWPNLVVASASQARVIGHDGVVLTHDLRIPGNDAWNFAAFHHVDGELLVYWASKELDGRLRGYWHSTANRPHPIDSENGRWWINTTGVSLPLPGGGRTTGGGVIHRGDTVIPAGRDVITDGASYWAWSPGEDGLRAWHEYDPATGEYGRPGMPAFLADALRTAPAGSTLHTGWILPAPSGEAAPAGVPVDGLLGWRVVRLPDGTMRGEDLAGRVVTVPGAPDGPGRPYLALTLPGDDRPRALIRDSNVFKIVDPDGVVTSVATADDAPGPFAAGTARLLPQRYWYHLRPRDPEGSAVLRRVDRDAAAALLAAAAGEDDLPALVGRSLPGISAEALVAGVAGVLRFAAFQQAALETVATRLTLALAGDTRKEVPPGPADSVLREALSGFGTGWSYAGEEDGTFRQLRLISRALRAAASPGPDAAGAAAMTGPGPDASASVPGASVPRPGAGPQRGGAVVRLHFDQPDLPRAYLEWFDLLDDGAAVAYRALSAFDEQERGDALRLLLHELDELGLVTADDQWRRFRLSLGDPHLRTPDGLPKTGTWLGTLPAGNGGLICVLHAKWTDHANADFEVLYHDPSGRFEVPQPYSVRTSAPVGVHRAPGWLASLLGELSARGPAEWRPEAADEFARLTGVSPTTARLVVAGMPNLEGYERNFLSAEARTTLGVKSADANVARNELRRLDTAVLRAVLAALLPEDPARLWTDGPDVAAAAAVWNEKVGHRPAVPEWLLAETARAVKTAWGASGSLAAVFDPAASPELSTDLRWKVRGDRVAPVDDKATGFTATTLSGFVPLAAWLAHRLPAGDPVRAMLPAALRAVRERLAAPGLLIDLARYVSLPEFRKVAGEPVETGEGWERYGAVVMATHDDRPSPGLLVSLLDDTGGDPYLRALRHDADHPFPVELSLRLAGDDRFAALLGDPGDPVEGKRDKDGTWWPQDPSRSVPGLVTEVAKEYGLGEDAASLYLMVLAMPDPTDRHVTRWTGWKPARAKAARAELAATDLVVEAERSRAGRSLFLPGGWVGLNAPMLPLEQWKLPMFDLVTGEVAVLGVVAPVEPVADLYRKAWRRVRDDGPPSFQRLQLKRGRRR